MRWPLHYQILAATVVGAVVGLGFNPGAAELPDARYERSSSGVLLEFGEKNPGNRGAPRDELWFGEPVVENGYIHPNDAPGFGVTLNEALL